jgi:hypothetical protein
MELQWGIAREGKYIRVSWAEQGDMFNPSWMEDTRSILSEDELDLLTIRDLELPRQKPAKRCITFGVEGSAGVFQQCLVVLEE